MQKKREEAFPYLAKAYELNPDDPDITIGYAYRMNERGKKSAAIKALRYLLSIDPENNAAKRYLQQLAPTPTEAVTTDASERRQERLLERNNQ